MTQAPSVLILGGSGQAGAATAALLRRWHPHLPLTIAGRDLARAEQVAAGLGAATAVTVDLTRGDLGLPAAPPGGGPPAGGGPGGRPPRGGAPPPPATGAGAGGA
ncbi:hypothetical protein AAHZ94_08915, partial [Streptomyces sp. HSW2009]